MNRNRLLVFGAILGGVAALGFWWLSPYQLGIRALERFDDEALRSRYAAMTCKPRSGGVSCSIPTSCGVEFSFGLTDLGWFSGYWSDANELKAHLWAACPEMISDPAERELAKMTCEGPGTPRGTVEIDPRREGECVGP